ncbi:MAG: flavin reductase family protein, partial [Flammeovirgaceae bacterium]
KIMTIDPKEIPLIKWVGYLQGSVAPRPIAFVSSIDKNGNVNVSPFSFFNLFSINPPILVFSPSRRVRDNTEKHTLQNVIEVPEVTINMVTYAMVEQTSLASCEYAKGVNEFVKAGFTQVSAAKVQPPRVAESPISFECQVKQVISLGNEGGAGNLVICEVLLAHFKDEIFDADGRINPWKVDAVARMGNDYYCRAQGDTIFEVPKPNVKLGIGFDQLPPSVRNSNVLSGNELGRLANIEKLPSTAELEVFKSEFPQYNNFTDKERHHSAKAALAAGNVEQAWKILLG